MGYHGAKAKPLDGPSQAAPNATGPERSALPRTGFAAYDDLVAAIQAGELEGSELATVLRDACHRPRDIEASSDYTFGKLRAVINAEDERLRQIGTGAGIAGWWQDYGIVAAALARAVAVSTERSIAARQFVVQLVRDVLLRYDLVVTLSANQWDKFYDGACRTQVPLDVLILLLKSAFARRTSTD